MPPATPPGARNVVLVVLDSCRFDAFATVRPPTMCRLGELQRRYSYASWTSPSHFNLMMGLLPHTSPQGVYASEVYQKQLKRWNHRLGIEGTSFLEMLPHLWLPRHLQRLGYHTQALVSLPVLNPDTPLNVGFDDYRLMDRYNDMRAMLDQLQFFEDRPTFALLNVGETHYPYALPDEPEDRWPRIHGLHGVLERLDQPDGTTQLFDEAQLARLRGRQIEAVRYLDGVVEALFDRLPANTWVVITADHGELFGEGGYFGHGPILHDKVLEVPFVEGLLR